LQIVAFGGGSVGDYAGFVASLVRRGVGFVQVPSTWLAAMDSAHGGKTALNVGAFKNQIGTFYPAQSIFIVREVLLAQPRERVHEAAGEYYKMQFLMKGRALARSPVPQELTSMDLWQDLPALVRAKWQIVRQDPYETKGPRAWLNLGHTVGHVLEAALQTPHGLAVHYGLAFATRWSQSRGLWKGPLRQEILPTPEEVALQLRQVRSPVRWLRRDKKMKSATKIRFVFMKKPGYPVTQIVSLQDLLREWKRQSQ
jgi:3-dehydroquinate synthase